MNLYEFSESRGYWKGSPPVVCIGPTDFVGEFIRESELRSIFQGCLTYRDEDTGTKYIGVWGTRNTSKFRRILRERGAKFTLRRGFIPSLAQRSRSAEPKMKGSPE